jgi:hypothetical protein
LQNRQKKHSYAIFPYRNRNRNKFINHIRAPGGHIQLTIMIDTQQQYIKLNIRGEISIIVKNKLLMTILRLISSKDVIKINKKCFLYAETYYMLRFVQIRNNRYENRLIFLLLANTNIVFL